MEAQCSAEMPIIVSGLSGFARLPNPHRIGRPRCHENPRPKSGILTNGERRLSISSWTTAKIG